MGDEERRVGLRGLAAAVERIDARTARIEVAIAGDQLTGAAGLQQRVSALERERMDRRLFRVMIAVGTFLGSALGAIMSPFAPHK